MKYIMIGTWKMAYDAIKNNVALLAINDKEGNVIVKTITEIEDDPHFTSVGYGGLPNINGEVKLDAGFMNGQTLKVGAVLDTKDIKNPIKVAQSLSHLKFNNILASAGAEEYAKVNHFEFKNLLTTKSNEKYLARKKELDNDPSLTAYRGHDTVGILSLDAYQNMFAGVSTSGLFMKANGRVGDSPLIGSGFYVDNTIGSAAATGVGEDIMKGVLSYQTVQLMKQGLSPNEAAQKAVNDLNNELIKRNGTCGSMSVIALNNKGEWGVGTNVEFSFVVGDNINGTIVYLAKPNKNNITTIEKASKEWIESYDIKHNQN